MADDFISKYLEHTHVYESPTSFWKWSAYCTIASILRDSCYRKQGDISTYPNIYVLLLADSAVHRKGNPVKFCEGLVGKTQNTKVISGRSSIQGILDELARGETNPKTGKLIRGGSALFSAPELSAGIVNDPEAIKILTDIYDFKDEYTSRLRGSGIFRIKNICFSMMAASNEDLLRDVYDTKAIFGGLLGRTFLVKPDEFRPGNSLFDIADSSKSMEALSHQLTEISKLAGEFVFTADAKKSYEDWYIPFRDSYREKKDKSGIAGRIHTGALKLSMILCVNYTRSLVIEKNHMEEAITECLTLMPNYNSFVMAGGKALDSEIGSIFLNELFESERQTLSKRDFLRKNWSVVTLEQFDGLVQKLIQAGMIQESMGTPEGAVYTMTTKCCDMLFKDKEKK